MASVTVTMPNSGYGTAGVQRQWQVTTGRPSIGNELTIGGLDRYLATILMAFMTQGIVSSGRVGISLATTTSGVDTGNIDFTQAMETNGTVMFTAFDGETVTVGGISDATEPYFWVPSNADAVVAFINHVDGLSDRTLTVTFNDNATVAPAFADSTGDAQAWTQNTAITPIRVPVATGTPTPTYAATGLPDGIAFNTATRMIRGTPSAAGSGTITVTATNSEGSATWTVAYTTVPDTTAPAFADDTGDAQSWTQNLAIAPITVPEATGNPTPTYAAMGALPAGIAFNTGTRVISGTPSTVASGTIRIRASNSEGNDDWTVAYTTNAFVSSGSANYDAIVMLPGAYAIRFTASGNHADYFESSPEEGMLLNNFPAGMFTDPSLYWIERVRGSEDGNELIDDDTNGYRATRIELHRGGSSQAQNVFVTGLSDGYSWVIINETTSEYLMWPANGQSAGPGSNGGTFGGGFIQYVIIPTDIVDTAGLNANNVKAIAQEFASTVASTAGGDFNNGLLNNEIIVGLIPNNTFRPTFVPPEVAPAFADSTGDAQTWTVGTAITDIMVPEASGNPSPAYVVVGTLPTGIAFNTTTRVISGTPAAVDSGTITIRATNSQGMADWTVDYATTAALVAPSFADNTGDAQSWVVGTAITNITVPSASGNPAPTYATVGALPAGIAFDTTTRVISGTPNTADAGTIRIRAENSEGSDDWTVAYTTSAALAPPSFTDNTGDLQRWTQTIAIAPLTIPEAAGNPTPTYAVVGTLPNGIVFSTTTRILSGTPADVASGTITIRATNSQGMADWTVDYITTAGLAPPSFTDDTGDAQDWTQGSTITPITVPLANGNPAPAYGEVGTLPTGISFDKLTRVISGAPTNLGSGTVTIQATNSEGTANWTVAYTTRAALVAPSFTDNTGDAQSWTTGTAIADITVPEAMGNPAPTYLAIGSLPAGIAFDTTTRIISGTPTVAGSGTITIQASNSEGDADWTVDFVTTLALAVPSFADPTGNPQSWTTNVSIIPINVPEAMGNPTPTYAVFGTLPMGISFDVGTRALSGIPTAVAFGTLTIRATNSQGSGDWTVAYSTAAPPVAPPIPTFLLEVDWGNDGTFSHPDADVSGDVVARHGIYCERGRGGHGSILYDQSRAGVLRAVLRNDDRKYDAISAESALGSLVTSQRLVRFSMSYPGVALTVLWTGYLDRIRPVERRSQRDELSMRALGLITLLNEARPLVTSVANDTIGGAARRVAEAAVPGIDTSLIVSTRSLVRWFKVPDETAAEAEFELERTEAGFFYEARDGRPVLETRNHRITASQTSTLTIADDGTGDVPTIEIEPVTRAQDIANVVRVPVHTHGIGALKVLWTAGSAIEIPASATIKLVVHYPNLSAPAGDVGVSSWEAVTANTDYTPQTDLTVTSEAEGDNLVITLVNGAATDITLPSLQARGVPWTESAVFEIEEFDQPSIDDYDPRPYAIPSRWISSISEARDYAFAVLSVHKEPRRRLIISWFGADNPARALGVDLSDRVTVFERDSGVSYFLEAIRHELTSGLKHVVTYTLSPVLPFGKTFIFDTSAFDTGTFGF